MITVGLDVGKERDPAALAVLRSDGLREGSHRPRWQALDISNIPLGTRYQDLATLLVTVTAELVAAGFPTVATVDATGIGGAVVELARTQAPELHIVAVTIGSGRCLTHNAPDDYTVGKHRLTESLQVALQQRGLDVPPQVASGELRTQLESFVAKPTATGRARHEADSGHDDLVLSLELAIWTGDTMYDQLAGVAP